MLSHLIAQLQIMISTYGAIGVFIAALTEEVIAPIPSTLVAMIAVFFLIPAQSSLLSAALVGIIKVAIPMALGISLGSLLFYGVAYYGGKPLLEKYGRWFGLSWKNVGAAEKKFAKNRRGEVALFLMRATPFFPSVAISTFAGLIRYPVKRFFIISLLGSATRSLIVALIGWQLRDAYLKIADTLDHLESFVMAAIIFGVAAYIVFKMTRKKGAID